MSSLIHNQSDSPLSKFATEQLLSWTWVPLVPVQLQLQAAAAELPCSGSMCLLGHMLRLLHSAL